MIYLGANLTWATWRWRVFSSPVVAPPLLVFRRVLMSVSWCVILFAPPLVLMLLAPIAVCLLVAVVTVMGGGDPRADFNPELEARPGLVWRTDRRCCWFWCWCCWGEGPILMLLCLLTAPNRWFERAIQALLLLLLLKMPPTMVDYQIKINLKHTYVTAKII